MGEASCFWGVGTIWTRVASGQDKLILAKRPNKLTARSLHPETQLHRRLIEIRDFEMASPDTRGAPQRQGPCRRHTCKSALIGTPSHGRSPILLTIRNFAQRHAVPPKHPHEPPESIFVVCHSDPHPRWAGPPRNQGATRRSRTKISFGAPPSLISPRNFGPVPVPQVALRPLVPSGDSSIRTTHT